MCLLEGCGLWSWLSGKSGGVFEGYVILMVIAIYFYEKI